MFISSHQSKVEREGKRLKVLFQCTNKIYVDAVYKSHDLQMIIKYPHAVSLH